MSLTGMYQYAQQVAQGKFDGTFEEQGGKLVIRGTVPTEDELNEIWNAIKTIPTWRDDINADIKVTGGAPTNGAAAPSERTYEVKPGDTLSGIAKSQLGDAGAYMKIFNLNKDQLSDPNLIKPGQVLRLP
jgi:LysM repeat protein